MTIISALVAYSLIGFLAAALMARFDNKYSYTPSPGAYIVGGLLWPITAIVVGLILAWEAITNL